MCLGSNIVVSELEGVLNPNEICKKGYWLLVFQHVTGPAMRCVECTDCYANEYEKEPCKPRKDRTCASCFNAVSEDPKYRKAQMKHCFNETIDSLFQNKPLNSEVEKLRNVNDEMAIDAISSVIASMISGLVIITILLLPLCCCFCCLYCKPGPLERSFLDDMRSLKGILVDEIRATQTQVKRAKKRYENLEVLEEGNSESLGVNEE